MPGCAVGETRSIALVTDYSLDFLGGAQRALYTQATALAEAGHRVTILAPPPRRDLVLPRRVTLVPIRAAVKVPGLGMPIVLANAGRRAQLAAALWAMDVDGVVLHSEFGIAASALHAARALRLPVAHTVHTFFWRAPHVPHSIASAVGRTLLAAHERTLGIPRHSRQIAEAPLDDAMRRVTAAVAASSDVVLSPSHHQAEALRAAGVPRVRVLSNTVPGSGTPGGRPHPRPGLRLLWAGRATPEKGLVTLLDALRALRADVRALVELRVAGAGRQIDDAARDSDLADVHFTGRVDPAGVTALLGEVDAVVVSSLGFDNQPMIALEAFRQGRPVIVLDPALAREFGGAALVTARPDAAGLAVLMTRLVRDDAPLTTAASAARAYAARATPEAHVAGLLSALEEAEHNRWSRSVR